MIVKLMASMDEELTASAINNAIDGIIKVLNEDEKSSKTFTYSDIRIVLGSFNLCSELKQLNSEIRVMFTEYTSADWILVDINEDQPSIKVHFLDTENLTKEDVYAKYRRMYGIDFTTKGMIE